MRAQRFSPSITPITSRYWGGAAASSKSPALSCGWRVLAGASPQGRPCTSTAAPTWAVDDLGRPAIKNATRCKVTQHGVRPQILGGSHGGNSVDGRCAAPQVGSYAGGI